MSKTFCKLEEVSLVNIISLSEQKLQKNFEVIMTFLNNSNDRISQLQSKSLSQDKYMTDQFKSINQMNHLAQSSIKQLQNRSDDSAVLLQNLRLDMFDQSNKLISAVESNKNQLNINLQTLKKQNQTMRSQIDYLNNEQRKVIDIINLKGQKSQIQMDRARKDIGQLIIKTQTNQKRVKNIEQHIQKIQVQTQNNPFSNLIVDGKPTKKYNELISKIANQIKNSIILEQNRNLPCLLKQKNLGNEEAYLQNAKKSSFVYSPLFNQQQQIKDLKQTINQMKSKIQQFDIKGNDLINKTFQKFNQDINEFKNLRNEMKRQSGKDKSQFSNNEFLQKLQQFRPQINKINSKLDIMQDKMAYSEKKLEENKKNTLQLINYIKQNNLSKYDEKIKSIQSDIFSQIKQINSKIQTKTNNVDFIKLCHHTEEKFRIINQILITKCEKVEVKKALLFIQSKIKEIILVISQDQQNEKDALITKKNIKCISCDKDLDKYSGLVSQDTKNWNMLPNKELLTQNLGKFGITKFGSLAKKLKKLEGGQLPLLRSRKQNQ